MHLLKQESLVCIFESPRLVALFNSTRTDETALYNLNNVAHAFVMHIVGLSRARRIVSAWLESHRSLESSVTCVFLSGCKHGCVYFSDRTAD